MSKFFRRSSALELRAMESSDDAYFSDMRSDISVVSAQVNFTRRLHHSHHGHNRRPQREVKGHVVERDDVFLESYPADKENCKPQTDDSRCENIFSFMRLEDKECKLVLNKGYSLPCDIESESCDCHCAACCSCPCAQNPRPCTSTHQHCCHKYSDCANDTSPNSVAEREYHNLPSPTSIDSWGHFSKHKRNHYKYRRSDYSSDSEDEGRSGVRKTPDATVGKQKSHLPSITLTRTSSLSSNQSFDKCSASGLDVWPAKEGVKAKDFQERIKVSVVMSY